MKLRFIVLWILILVIVDQAIKVIIYNFFLECNFEIIPSLLEFKAQFNNKYSYLNSLLYAKFSVNIGFYAHIILFAISQMIVFCIYASFKIKLNNAHTKLLDVFLIFQIAAHGGKHEQELLQGLPERRLTPRECALIQSFPPNYDFVIKNKLGRKGSFLVSPSQAYKVIGNAVPPLLAYHIAKRLEDLWDIYFDNNTKS